MRRHNYPDLYSKQLLSEGHGYPLFDPKPPLIGQNPSPAFLSAYKEGVQVGDLGLVDGTSGNFKFIFNIFKPADDPINIINGVPPGFQPLPYEDNRFTRNLLYLRKNASVCSKKAQAVEVDVSGGAAIPLLGAGLDLEFQFAESQGAALFLPAGADRINYDAFITMREYIKNNALSWYQFAIERDVGAYNGCLYLITGYDRTSCYYNLAFSSSSWQSSMSFKFSSALMPTGNVGLSLSYSSVPNDHRWLGESPRTHTLNNLSPFIRGFKIMVKPSLLSSLKLSVRIWDLAEEKLLSKIRQGWSLSPNGRFTSPSSSHSDSSVFNLQSETPTSSSSDPSIRSELLWEPSPTASDWSITRDSDSASLSSGSGSGSEFDSDVPIYQLYHPSDIINAYTLEKCPNVLVAITHDNEWLAVLNETDQMPDSTTLIIRMLQENPSRFEQVEASLANAEDLNDSLNCTLSSLLDPLSHRASLLAGGPDSLQVYHSMSMPPLPPSDYRMYPRSGPGGMQQVMLSFGSNATPFSDRVLRNVASGSWYSDSRDSNHASSGNTISNNRDSFNATAQGEISVYDEEMIDGTQDDASEDEMDMDDYNNDFRVDTASKKKAYEIDYKSLSQSDVEKLMKQDIDHVVGITGVDESTAALLLRHSNWNKEWLIEKYMDNPTTAVVEAGVTAPEPTSPPPSARTHYVSSPATTKRTTRSSSKLLSWLVSPRGGSSSKPSSIASFRPSKQSSKSEEPEPFVCSICFDDSAELHPLSLDCGHLSCSGCWAAYITSKIRDEGEHSIRCMAEGCALVAPDPFIRSILLPPEGSTNPPLDPQELKANQTAWNRFQELLARNFVASISSLKFCPYPGCTRTVKCPMAASKSSLTTIVPTVSCGSRGIPVSEDPKSQPSASLLKKEHKFCFGCTVESDHRPVVCGVAKMWLKKCETENWIKSNTKECSQCQSTVEKYGGWNHMTCKKCKHEFCWVCMGPWSEHGTQWYSCNRYYEKAGVDARDVQSQSRASLERYLHYYNRWANHEQSAKLSIDLYAKTEKKMENMQLTSELTWIEVQFMKKAVEEAEKCRMTLKWTYAMAYYLAPGNEKELFEDNQRDLEKAVEDLSELLESPIKAEEIATLRQRVTDKTVYVQKRNDIVLDDTAKGFLEGRWRWNVPVEGFEEDAEA